MNPKTYGSLTISVYPASFMEIPSNNKYHSERRSLPHKTSYMGHKYHEPSVIFQEGGFSKGSHSYLSGCLFSPVDQTANISGRH